MKNALIWGITGQDGSYLAELLLSKGYKVTGVTRRVSVSTLARIEHLLPKINIVEGDITDGFNVSKVISDAEPDEIYNLAAQSHVATSFKQPSLTWDITASGVLNILEAIRYSPRKNSIRFYQASSSEMFGKNFTESSDYFDGRTTKKFQDENTAFVPQSPYAIAKLAAHHLVRNYRESYGVHASSGILFNHESERRGEHFVTRKITKWIGAFVKWTRDGNKPEDFPKLRLGNLEARRDWGHAEDYVNAMWLMLQQDTADDYVVATGETHSVREFIHLAFNHIGINDWSDYIEIDPEFYRPAEVDYLLGIPTKAETKLGWRRNVSFQNLVERMVDNDVQEARLQRSCIQEVSRCCSKKRQIHMSNV